MKLHANDPDIETLVRRIRNGSLILQPDFQRGTVWNRAKQQRLIDTILRNWYVPPVHVLVREDSGVEEVLDGQQRLQAIADFAADAFVVDGHIAPDDPDISRLHSLSYQSLPLRYQRRFDSFSLRVLRITDYTPDEPAELFFRLNQSVSLTPAEVRNAFAGKPRAQIRALVDTMANLGLNRDSIGFANTRMAYDDTLARLALLLERGTLLHLITARELSERYRSSGGFARPLLELVRDALSDLSHIVLNRHGSKLRLNKATFFSWLLFLAVRRLHTAEPIGVRERDFVWRFEGDRIVAREGTSATQSEMFGRWADEFSRGKVHAILNVFNDRASSRVQDVTSVQIRDFILWFLFALSNTTALRWHAVLGESHADMVQEINASKGDSRAARLMIEWAVRNEWGSRVE